MVSSQFGLRGTYGPLPTSFNQQTINSLLNQGRAYELSGENYWDRGYIVKYSTDGGSDRIGFVEQTLQGGRGIPTTSTYNLQNTAPIGFDARSLAGMTYDEGSPRRQTSRSPQQTRHWR